MIPTLHNWEDIAYFNTFGLGALSEVIDCTVTEVRNGEFDLMMTYPVTGSMYNLLENGKIIMATHDATKNQTAFSIYRIESNIDGIVTIYAHHLTYDLNYVLIRGHPSYYDPSATVQNDLRFMRQNAFGGRYGRSMQGPIANPYEATMYYISTNIPNNTYPRHMPGPMSLRNYVLDVAKKHNAEIVWGPQRTSRTTGVTNGYVHIYTYILVSRGVDSGATIRYGGNLTAAEKAEDVDDTYGRVYPYWQTDNGEYVYYNSSYNDDAEDATKAYLKNFKYLDMSPDFDEQPTSEQKSTYAQAFLEKEKPFIPSESITINFSPFQDVGYDYDASVLQNVCLCDWVNLEIEQIGVSKKVKVIKTVYDTLMDRYKSLTIGEVEKSFAETVQESASVAADSGSGGEGGGGSQAITWVDLTVESGVTNPSTNVTGARKLQIGKVGNRAYIRGQVDVAGLSSGNKIIANLPSEYVPSYPVYSFGVFQGSHIAKMFVLSSGEFGIVSVYNISDGARHTTKNWLDCSFNYWLD